ncbi:hypothetical protein PCANC_28413 [Puccinia coronata f. sp. avenae]|uniref:Uncharacterized protein n=1 Tax=Puccinia coronata f. sp. avenae TaxID=200324 RepID=A0A2N5TIB2_9BASI|nr:hypothetical protein PCANC_28413 [Puccinia coronata f. sp. avenae]
MTIQHRDGNIHKNADGLSRWALPNDPSNPAYDPEEEPDDEKFPIMGIHVSTFKADFFETVRDGYQKENNAVIITQLLMKDCKDPQLASGLSGVCQNSVHSDQARSRALLPAPRSGCSFPHSAPGSITLRLSSPPTVSASRVEPLSSQPPSSTRTRI